MTTDSLTTEQLLRVSGIIEDVMATREYQKLGDILPLVLVLVKKESDKQLAREIHQSKFYSLDWIRLLLID